MCTETFWTNPQYRITVTDPDEDDDENMGTLIVALMQKDRRKKRNEGLDMLTLGYCVYKVSELAFEI
jgi:calpain, invertebrate